MITLEEFKYHALSDATKEQIQYLPGYHMIEHLDLTREEQDQMFLLEKESFHKALEILNNKWEPFFPLSGRQIKDKDRHMYDCNGKTDEQIKQWLHDLGIPYDTQVLVSGLVTTWKMVIRHNLLGSGVDPLDGSWRFVFVREGAGYALFYDYKNILVD